MNVLEKILEEIDVLIEKHKNKAYEFVAKEPLTKCYTNTDIEQIKVHELAVIKKRIRSHMDNDGWIPVSKRLPEPNKIVKVTMHCSEWISDYNSAWVPEDEKKHHEEEYIVNVGYMGEDGYWIVFDGEGYVCCDKEFGTDQGCAYSIVTAWKSFSEPYKGE